MTGTYPQIIEIANASGIPNNPTSTFRKNAVTLSGKRSHHADGNAVDFGGYNQDALAALFMMLPTLEVFHYSEQTGKWYGKSRGKDVNPDTHQALVEQHKNHLHVAMAEDQVGPGVLDAVRKGISVLSPAAGAFSGMLPTPRTITEGIGNVGNALGSLAQSAMSISQLASVVTKAFLPTSLIRGVMFMFGTIFVLIGIWFLAREVRESSP